MPQSIFNLHCVGDVPNVCAIVCAVIISHPRLERLLGSMGKTCALSRIPGPTLPIMI